MLKLASQLEPQHHPQKPHMPYMEDDRSEEWPKVNNALGAVRGSGKKGRAEGFDLRRILFPGLFLDMISCLL